MAVMRNILINGKAYPHPKDFAMQSVPNIVSSITTMSGKNLADVNGWVYSDVTLSWEWIDAAVLVDLINDTDPIQGTFDFTFDDMKSGTRKTIKAIRTGVGGQKLAAITPDGKVQWTGIQMSLSFPDCYK